MLPYLDRRDWYKGLVPGYAWNSSQNKPITQRPLEPVVNPALGPSATEAGFPVTHYVGVGGVLPGGDAAKPEDFRPGLFNFSQPAASVPDGASNTLAILGVMGQLGPWAQGGRPTVRNLTQRPYVNGPDGFGSGQPNGMVAGMADGSVRFVSKDADPEVLEQLATVNGKEEATVAMLDEKAPRKAADKAREKTAKADKPKGGKPAAKEPAAPDDVADDEDEPQGEDEAAPVKVDVQARLADRVRQIDFPNVTLLDAVRTVARLSTLRVTFDVDAMAEVRAGLRDPVKLRLENATVNQVLQAIAVSRGLVCVVDGEQVLITSAKKKSGLRQEKYDVADLVGPKGTPGTELAGTIVKVVAPETWREAGGQGTIRVAGSTLIVDQSEAVHQQVRAFCEKLRQARGLSGKAGEEKTPLTTRVDLARAKLLQPITANFFEKTPLVRILQDLERLGQVTIVVDWAALAREGISPDVPTMLRATQQSLSESLLQTLQPLGLYFRVVGPDTLEVTTRKAVFARLELEFHPAGTLVNDRQSPEGLIERIKGQVAAGSWNDAGGPGILLYDKPSGCLIVLQSQPVQARLQALLKRWAAEPGKAPSTRRQVPTAMR
jgi:hypothetical protein